MKDDDFKLLRGFADGQTNERTNEQTFVIVEKNVENFANHKDLKSCIISKVCMQQYNIIQTQ